jgi:hypothetical protein
VDVAVVVGELVADLVSGFLDVTGPPFLWVRDSRENLVG